MRVGEGERGIHIHRAGRGEGEEKRMVYIERGAKSGEERLDTEEKGSGAVRGGVMEEREGSERRKWGKERRERAPIPPALSSPFRCSQQRNVPLNH